MRVTSYGLFWRRSEIDWEPGQGAKDAFRLLGRNGTNRGKIRVTDFRRQRGIYILYDEYGPCYVGLTQQRGLGQRLKEHTADHLKNSWDRFTWFGFWSLANQSDKRGVFQLIEPVVDISEDTNTTIGDLEALLIRAIGPKLNRSKMKFKGAEEWEQIDRDETATYLARIVQREAA